MRLEGIHHVTAITANAPRNVDFYARVLGLRMVKKTVNFDAPDVYHLYYADEVGSPGSVLTFFEFPRAAPGRAGAGMVHRIVWRVSSQEGLEFWRERLEGEGVQATAGASLRFADPDSLEHELVAGDFDDAPLAARADDIPLEHALLGFDGARAYSADPPASDALLSGALEFTRGDEEWEYVVQGDQRHARWAYDPAPRGRAVQGAGTVHHIAWASRDQDHEEWRRRVADAGARVTPIIDRSYFLSIYFREPSGVLFEIATLSPGFAADEPLEELGQSLKLPKQHEHLRPALERRLTPLVNPRVGAPGR